MLQRVRFVQCCGRQKDRNARAYNAHHWYGIVGFDHGVGHPLLLLGNEKPHNCLYNNELNELSYCSEWPKVADAGIEATDTIGWCGSYPCTASTV
jgi:hypothetical protein